MDPKFRFNSPDEAIQALASRLATASVQQESSPLTGRVLAKDVVADRDSPAANVSAMDGYGIRLSDLKRSQPVPIGAESTPGSEPPAMPRDAVVQIFTGAIVPDGCDAVVKREDTEELGGAIRFRESAMATQEGEHIRRAGENAKTGSVVLSSGQQITAAQRATMANFGCESIDLFAPVRVCIITTGDEVGSFINERPQPWQLRNSNGASLTALLEGLPWISIESVKHVRDDRTSLAEMLREATSQSDAVLLTGGVSMGDYDYVPEVIGEVGGEIVFHGLPLRPGKPILGAATDTGKLIMGLPGNPVSATIGCRRMALPLIAKISGQATWRPPCPTVQIQNPDDKTIPLHWLRLVRMLRHGVAETVLSQGSGDLVSLGQSTGFIELPPAASGSGPWPLYTWLP